MASEIGIFLKQGQIGICGNCEWNDGGWCTNGRFFGYGKEPYVRYRNTYECGGYMEKGVGKK